MCDAAGTLFDVRGSVGERYSAAARRFGVAVPADELQRSFTHAFRDRPPLAFPGLRGRSLIREERAWWFALVERVFGGRIPEDLVRPCFDELFEEFRSAGSWSLFPDTRAALEKLRAAGYRLAVVSNFDSRIDDVLAALGIDSFFEQVTISSRCGAAKPDPVIFREALRLMKVGAECAVHAGDSLHEDVLGARRAAVHAVLVDRRGENASWDGGWRVRDLAELCSDLGL